MKLLTLLAATLIFSPLGWRPLLAAAEPTVPAWSFRLSLQEQKTPLQQELLKKFQPALGALSNFEFLKQLAWIKVVGLPGAKRPDEADFIVHLHFREDGTAKALLKKIGEGSIGQWEEMSGLAVLKLNAPTKINGSDIAYLTMPDERHIAVCSSPLAVEALAGAPRESYLAYPKAGEIVCADFDLPELKGAIGKSELLTMLDGHLALKLLSGGDGVQLQGSADLADKRSANRARRIVEGLIAALSTQLPADLAGPLDERLEIAAEGKTLTGAVKLTNAEVERWLKAIETDLKTEKHIGAEHPPGK